MKNILQFKNEVYELVKDEYTVLSDKYINNKTKIKMKHNKCGFEWEVTPHNFLNNNTRCPYCSGKYKRTHNDFIKEVYNLVGNEYTVLSKYKTDGTKKPDKVTFKHNYCGKEFDMRAHDFLKLGSRCPYCAKEISNKKQQLSEGEFLRRIYTVVGAEYTVLDEYSGCREEIRFKHNKCGNVFKMKPKKFLYDNNRCPYCKRSKGEERIENWLKSHDIDYEREYKFLDCKYKNPLPFDFKLEYEDGSLLLIEFDGIQHFQETWHDNFQIQQKRDEIKNNYCKDHNIDLIRIKYTDYDNIEKILESKIC